MHKNKLKWIKDLNLRPKTIKILKEITGSKIVDIAHSNFFQMYLPRQWKQKKNKQMGPHQTKKFLHSNSDPEEEK